MGFNKRIVSKEYILTNIKNNKTLAEIFLANAVICNDDFSTKCFNLHVRGFSDEEIFKQLEKLV